MPSKHTPGRQRGQAESYSVRHCVPTANRATVKKGQQIARQIERRKQELADEAWLRRLLRR
jgi:hypothetical protein